jgi:hypothetical protein
MTSPPGDVPAQRRSRRWARTAAGVMLLTLAAAGCLVAINGRGDQDDGDDDQPPTPSTATATVELRTLEEHDDLDGTLGYGDTTDVSLAAESTITGLAPVGSVVDRGQSLVEVDSHGVPLLFGPKPMWRPLGPDVTNGVDVEQLEANLLALGVVTTSELTVDQDWTSATTSAVKKWQKARGLEQTGSLGPGDIVFLPGAVRVAEHPIQVGGPISGPVIGVTSTTRLVTIDLEASQRSLVAAGKPVVVVLPDGTEVAGKIGSVGDVATGSGGDGGGGDDGGDGGGGGDDPPEATIDVVVTIDDPAALTAAAFDQAPVTVQVVSTAAENVVAVPVEALLVLAEGGFAVELVDDDGASHLVSVKLGASADGWIQVTGDVAEGDKVVVPQ